MLVMNKKLSYLLCFVAFFTSSVMANQAGDCDPVVKLGQQANTLQQALTTLAKQHNFELNFPVNADQSVESVEGMRLSQALKYLTSDVNTVLQHEKVDGCVMARLVSMEVLPVGEDTEYVYVKPAVESQHVVRKKPKEKRVRKSKKKNRNKGRLKAEESVTEDMELYAEDVLLNQRELDKTLSPEQKREFRKAKRLVQKRLIAEGLLDPKKVREQRLKEKEERGKGRGN